MMGRLRIRFGTQGRPGRNGKLEASRTGLGKKSLPTATPVPGWNLVQGTEKSHGTFPVAHHIRGSLLLDAVEIGAEFGL